MIFVIGGAGFIGANFVLQRMGCADQQIVNLDKLTYAGNLDNLQLLRANARHVFVHGDMGDGALLARLLAQYRPQAVVNFAAQTHVDRSIHSPRDFVQTNVLATFELLESIRTYWAGLPSGEQAAFRLLHVSTDEVYGSLPPSAPAFTEMHRYAPNSPYAASKAAGDHLMRAYHHTYGLPVLMTHCSNNYGPFQFPEKLIPLLIVHALADQPLPIYGDGMQVRDWLHVSDHCRAISEVLQAGRVGEVYNVGGGNEKSNLEVVHSVCALLDELHGRVDGRSYASQISHVQDRLGHDQRYGINADKLQTELGWRPEQTLETGLRQTVQWYLEHPGWIERVKSGAYRQAAPATLHAPTLHS